MVKENIGIVLAAVAFSILVCVAIFVSITFWPFSRNEMVFRPNSLARAYSWWDSSIYIDICMNGYGKETTYPENLIKFAFYPALPVLICLPKWLLPDLPYGVAYYSVPIVESFLLSIFLSLCLWFFLQREYQSSRLRRYVFWTYLLFPFSFFFHIPYTESLFIGLVFLAIRFLRSNRVWLSHGCGLLLGLVRVTSLPVGILQWLFFTKIHLREKSPVLGKYLWQSAGFSTYVVGTICLALFFWVRFANPFLFLDAEEKYFQRQINPRFYQTILDDMSGKKTWYDNIDWSGKNDRYGTWWYTPDFRRIFLLFFPFAVAIVGSAILVAKRRWFDLVFAWSLFLFPLLSSTTSLNRYLLQSYPFIFAVSELAYSWRVSRWILPVFYALGFCLTLFLYTHGYWVG